MSKKEPSKGDKEFPTGDVISFSNWNLVVPTGRHGSRLRYDKDILAFNKSEAKTVQVSTKNGMRLDSLAVALRERIKALGLNDKLQLKARRDKNKTMTELWIIKKET